MSDKKPSVMMEYVIPGLTISLLFFMGYHFVQHYLSLFHYLP